MKRKSRQKSEKKIDYSILKSKYIIVWFGFCMALVGAFILVLIKPGAANYWWLLDGWSKILNKMNNGI